MAKLHLPESLNEPLPQRAPDLGPLLGSRGTQKNERINRTMLQHLERASGSPSIWRCSYSIRSSGSWPSSMWASVGWRCQTFTSRYHAGASRAELCGWSYVQRGLEADRGMV